MDKYIIELIKEAKKSLKSNDVPVAALIVENNKIIAKGHNKKEKTNIITKHAEIIALEKACKKKKSWHLDGCTIYITMEPCLMCMGAITQSRIDKIFYLVANNKYELIEKDRINKMNIKKVQIENEIYQQQIQKLLKNFFDEKRK